MLGRRFRQRQEELLLNVSAEERRTAFAPKSLSQVVLLPVNKLRSHRDRIIKTLQSWERYAIFRSSPKKLRGEYPEGIFYPYRHQNTAAS